MSKKKKAPKVTEEDTLTEITMTFDNGYSYTVKNPSAYIVAFTHLDDDGDEAVSSHGMMDNENGSFLASFVFQKLVPVVKSVIRDQLVKETIEKTMRERN